MGLDMYLEKETYVGNKWKEPTEQAKVEIKGVKQERVSTITEEVGYWRKANMIHSWIVEHVQDGKDDCGRYEFSQEKMKELLDIVNLVLEHSKLVPAQIANGMRMTDKGWEPIMQEGKTIEDPTMAQKLLPTKSGFFFGNEDYNEYYYDDLVLTKEILEKCLADDGDYYYSSSW